MTHANLETTDREIVITRLINAPPELVFDAWSDPRHLANWWGPRGFSVVTKEMNAKPGGSWRYTMHFPDGSSHEGAILFTEVERPKRLAFEHQLCESDVTVTFEDEGDKTRLIMRMLFVSAEKRDEKAKQGVSEGAGETFDRLEELLAPLEPGQKPFVLSREFNAPRELVFQAWTEARHLRHWWGPKDCEVEVLRLDLRPGGTFHYSMKNPGGMMWGKFVFREIKPPERLLFISCFANASGETIPVPFDATWPREMLTEIRFAEDKGKTTVTIRSTPIHATAVERKTFADGHKSMTGGWGGSLDKLAAHLAKLHTIGQG